MIKKDFDIQIDKREEWTERSIRPTPLDEKVINVFTDGSKTDLSSGCGYIIRGKDFSSKGFRNLGKKTSVFQTEITAMIDSTEDLLGKETKGKVINYYVDSQAAIKALDGYIVRVSSVLTCKKLLNK